MRSALITPVLLAAPTAASACPVCFGQNDSALASGINLGILVMLGVTVTVLAGFASFIIYLTRRARAAARDASPEEAAGLPSGRAGYVPGRQGRTV